jgi:hypothetical protein
MPCPRSLDKRLAARALFEQCALPNLEIVEVIRLFPHRRTWAIDLVSGSNILELIDFRDVVEVDCHEGVDCGVESC